MVKRKTPIEHDVDGYTRDDGTRVGQYRRGSGTRLRKQSRVVGNKIDWPNAKSIDTLNDTHDLAESAHDALGLKFDDNMVNYGTPNDLLSSVHHRLEELGYKQRKMTNKEVMEFTGADDLPEFDYRAWIKGNKAVVIVHW